MAATAVQPDDPGRPAAGIIAFGQCRRRAARQEVRIAAGVQHRPTRLSAPRRSPAAWITLLVAAFALPAAGCGSESPPETPDVDVSNAPAGSPSIVPDRDDDQPGASAPRIDHELIDSSIPAAVAGEDGWDYQQSATADLTGDGSDERVVMTARVEVHRGRPLWDDGQPWQVYVETGDGARTYIYARRLQLGTLTMRVTRPEPGEPAAIVLLEHLPDRISLYEVSFGGPGRVTVEMPFQRDVDPRGDTASPDLP